MKQIPIPIFRACQVNPRAQKHCKIPTLRSVGISGIIHACNTPIEIPIPQPSNIIKSRSSIITLNIAPINAVIYTKVAEQPSSEIVLSCPVECVKRSINCIIILRKVQ